MYHNLIADFTQMAVMGPITPFSRAASTGACHNFTIDWLRLMFNDAGAVSDLDARRRMRTLSAQSGGANPVLQKTFDERWQEGGFSYRVADQMMIVIRGLKEESLSIDASNFDQMRLVHQIKTPLNSGFIYTFWFPSVLVPGTYDAHTIGFFRPLIARRGELVPTTEYVSAFDSNYGEYYMQVIEFNYWFNRLKAYYGGIITYHMLKYVSKQ